MRKLILFSCLAMICFTTLAQKNQKAGVYIVPDSIKATGIYTEVMISKKDDIKKINAYMNVGETSLAMRLRKGKKEIHFSAYKYGKALVTSPGVIQSRLTYTWEHGWNYNEKYIFLVMAAVDSAAGNSIYSGYIYLPASNKWKLIGTLASPYSEGVTGFTAFNKNKKNYSISFSNRWLLRRNNTWKALDSQTTKPPVLRPMSNVDSIAQQQLEEISVMAKLPGDSVVKKEGIFYQMLKEGGGRMLNVTDTIVIHYKGWLLSNGETFDETKEKPATFPLNRLIKGWQIGVPQVRVGGKIRLYIPSGSAYGIRTFSTDIPPNSTLVFEIEVLEAREKL